MADDPETPDGGISLAELRLCRMLADCPSFQQLVRVNGADQALLRIYENDLPMPIATEDSEGDIHSKEELLRLRPFAVVSTDRRQGGWSTFCAAYDTFADAGRILITIEDNVPCELAKDNQRLMNRFQNTVGRICRELIERRNQAGFLGIDRIDLMDGPWRADESLIVNQGDHLFVTFLVSWGAGSQ